MTGEETCPGDEVGEDGEENESIFISSSDLSLPAGDGGQEGDFQPGNSVYFLIHVFLMDRSCEKHSPQTKKLVFVPDSAHFRLQPLSRTQTLMKLMQLEKKNRISKH